MFEFLLLNFVGFDSHVMAYLSLYSRSRYTAVCNRQMISHWSFSSRSEKPVGYAGWLGSLEREQSKEREKNPFDQLRSADQKKWMLFTQINGSSSFSSSSFSSFSSFSSSSSSDSWESVTENSYRGNISQSALSLWKYRYFGTITKVKEHWAWLVLRWKATPLLPESRW